MTELTADNLMLLEQYLLKCWSIETSSKWTTDNPYRGQCGVTALVINDLFGGDIFKTDVEGQWHFYNLIDGKRFDFTSKQFNFKINYQDIESSRDEAFADTNEYQYSTLKNAMMQEYKNAPA